MAAVHRVPKKVKADGFVIHLKTNIGFVVFSILPSLFSLNRTLGLSI